jgi:hypothetical protein
MKILFAQKTETPEPVPLISRLENPLYTSTITGKRVVKKGLHYLVYDIYGTQLFKSSSAFTAYTFADEDMRPTKAQVLEAQARLREAEELENARTQFDKRDQLTQYPPSSRLATSINTHTNASSGSEWLVPLLVAETVLLASSDKYSDSCSSSSSSDNYSDNCSSSDNYSDY